MTALRVATLAAVGALLAWVLDSAVIAVAGGPGRSPLEGPLVGVGLGLLALAFAAAGAELSSGRSLPVRAAAVVGGLIAGAAAIWVVDAVVAALAPEPAGWAHDGAGRWVVGLLTAAVLGAWLTRKERTREPSR